MHSDPIADMLTRVRNASRARKARVKVPFSQLKLNIAELLQSEGFIEGFREVTADQEATAGSAATLRKHRGPKSHALEMKLKYDKEGEPVILKIQRMSTPGLRRYYNSESIPKVLGGLGVVILTTSKGLMTDRQAREQRVGGEALCAVY